MLAGLIFAVQDSDDRPGALSATLPFLGTTLIEYQARLLIAAGVSQIVVVVARLTPELLGAVARIGRRGITVDTVRSAVEASAKLHPLSHLLVLADGLVTTEAVLAPLARDGGDALLVMPEDEAPPAFERLGGGLAWAGIARLDARRLAEVAAMPRDYDVQSALLRAAGQARAAHVALPAGDARAGHGIERRGAALEARSSDLMTGMLAARPGWFDRWIVRPIVRAALPIVMRRGVPPVAIGLAATAAGLAGVAALWSGYVATGLLLSLAGVTAAAAGAAFAWLRDEAWLVTALQGVILIVPALAALLLGRAADGDTGELTAEVIAVALVAAGALGERATVRARTGWWGAPPIYLLVLAIATLAGYPVFGLAITATYAVATLAAAIEVLRRQA